MRYDYLLTLLKLDLQMIGENSEFDTLLLQYLDAAEQMIQREGITLSDSREDDQLRVMYAAYLYRKRAEDNPVMPRMLRYALNNRVFGRKES